VTAVSRYLRDVTVKEFGVKRAIDVVPNFVDVHEYRPDGASPFARALVHPGEQLLVHVSNFRPVKRIPDVLAIFDRVRRKVPSRLLLVGDGPGRSMAERLAREGGFEDRAIFLGNVAAIEKILPAARLALLPSDAESFGLAALEAMACGVPVVGTAAGGLPEVVDDGLNGFLRPVGDVGRQCAAAVGDIELAVRTVTLLEPASRGGRTAVRACPRVIAMFPCAETMV
jgi:N-acetyl-alpha-D-glucosaminyl L-malate synthase BshA